MLTERARTLITSLSFLSRNRWLVLASLHDGEEQWCVIKHLRKLCFHHRLRFLNPAAELSTIYLGDIEGCFMQYTTICFFLLTQFSQIIYNFLFYYTFISIRILSWSCLLKFTGTWTFSCFKINIPQDKERFCLISTSSLTYILDHHI